MSAADGAPGVEGDDDSHGAEAVFGVLDDGTPLLDRESLLRLTDFKVHRVRIPDWGVIGLRTLTSKQQVTWEIATETDKAAIRETLLVLAICDEEGAAIFSQEDIPMLREKSTASVRYAFDIACRISGLRRVDIEELAGNSRAGPSEDSDSN